MQPGQSLVGYGRDKQTRYKYGRHEPVVVEVDVGEMEGLVRWGGSVLGESGMCRLLGKCKRHKITLHA